MANSGDSVAGRESPDLDLEQFRYVYTPLPTASSIRLVSLATPPDYEDSILFLSMKVVDLDENPVYDALSYTWGNPISVFRTQEELASAEAEAQKLQPVICDDRVMHIRRNLFDFLNSWRLMLAASAKDDDRAKEAQAADLMPPTELWIDALSINQEDIDEKSSQVNMMGRIYSATRKVNIWLGPEDYFTRPALQLAIKLQGIGQMQARAVQNLDDDEVAKAFGLPKLSSSIWWSLFAFLHRAWFRRVWVMQELAFAPKVQLVCGLITFAWSTLTNACAILFESRMGDSMDFWAWLELTGPAFGEPLFLEDLTPILHPRERPDSERNLFTTLHRIYSGKSYQNVIRLEAARVGDGSRLKNRGDGYRLGTSSRDLIPSVPVLYMLDASRRFEASDPRDKIYAILSLAKRDAHDSEQVSELRRPIAPNYRLSIEEVFIESSWYTLLSGKDLELLMRTYLVEGAESDDHDLNLPSWVPNWTVIRAETPLWTLTPYRNSKWSASRDSYWSLPTKDRIHGTCLPIQGLRVDTLEAVVVSGRFSLSKSGEVAAKLPHPYPWTQGDQTPDEVLWRTLIANYSDTNYPATSEFTQIFFDSWMDENREISREYHTEEGMADKEKEDDYYRFVHNSRKLFPQEDGLLEKYWARQEHGDDELGDHTGPTEDSRKDLPRKADTASDSKRQRLAALRPFSIEEGNRTAKADKPPAKGPTLLPRYQDSEPPLSQVEKMMKEMLKNIDNLNTPKQGLTVGETEKSDSLIENNEAAEADTASKPLKTRPGPSKLHREFDRLKLEFSPHRRVFRSRQHYLGNGPKCSRLGDEIWLLAGSKVPFVLRPQGSGKYVLIGDAYVHGIMHGEAFDSRNSTLSDIELV